MAFAPGFARRVTGHPRVMHELVTAVPVGASPNDEPDGTRHTLGTVTGAPIEIITADADLWSCVRALDQGVPPDGQRLDVEWLVIDLSAVTEATPFECGALLSAMDRARVRGCCLVVPPHSEWLCDMLPARARRLTFQSIGDAVQMVAFAVEGHDGGWSRRRVGRDGIGGRFDTQDPGAGTQRR